MFGINIDPQMGNEKFEYLIADVYNPSVDIPDGRTDSKNDPGIYMGCFSLQRPSAIRIARCKYKDLL